MITEHCEFCGNVATYVYRVATRPGYRRVACPLHAWKTRRLAKLDCGVDAVVDAGSLYRNAGES